MMARRFICYIEQLEEYDLYISIIGYASSIDGFNFSATPIGDKIFITYVVLSDYVKSYPKVFSVLAVTKNYNKFNKFRYNH